MDRTGPAERPQSAAPPLLVLSALVLSVGGVAAAVAGGAVLWVLPALLVGAGAVAFLLRFPLAPSAAFILGFPLIASYSTGLTPGELVYGLYLVGYLALWFFVRLIVYEERVLYTATDWALLLFLVGATLSAVLPRLIGGPGSTAAAFGEWSSLIMIAGYFPVKEAVWRYPAGLRVVLTSLLAVAAFFLLRNVFQFRELALQATQVWQVARGRVSANEVFMLLPALGALTAAVSAHSGRHRVRWIVVAGLFLGGLLLTQSRGYWVDYAFGFFLLAVLAPALWRRRLLAYALLCGGGVLLLGWAFLGSLMELLLAGITERILSILTSADQDISLINRFFETDAVIAMAKRSPLLGWGLGAEYYGHDIIAEGAYTRQFVHNGYVGLWFKTGIWGVALMGCYWASTVRRGLRLFRTSAPTAVRATGLMVSVGLLSLLPSILTSSPFFVEDQLLLVGVLGGVVAGLADPRRAAHAPGA